MKKWPCAVEMEAGSAATDHEGDEGSLAQVDGDEGAEKEAMERMGGSESNGEVKDASTVPAERNWVFTEMGTTVGRARWGE